jgi:hypothetical protein
LVLFERGKKSFSNIETKDHRRIERRQGEAAAADRPLAEREFLLRGVGGSLVLVPEICEFVEKFPGKYFNRSEAS